MATLIQKEEMRSTDKTHAFQHGRQRRMMGKNSKEKRVSNGMNKPSAEFVKNPLDGIFIAAKLTYTLCNSTSFHPNYLPS